MGDGTAAMPVTAFGFLAFFRLERYAAMHRRDHDDHTSMADEQKHAILSAAGLCVPSFLDGISIGVGFSRTSSPQ